MSATTIAEVLLNLNLAVALYYYIRESPRASFHMGVAILLEIALLGGFR